MMWMIPLILSVNMGVGGDTVLSDLPAFPFWSGRFVVQNVEVERVWMVPLDSVSTNGPTPFFAPGRDVVSPWKPEQPVSWIQHGDTLLVSVWLQHGEVRYTRVRLIWEGHPGTRTPPAVLHERMEEHRTYTEIPVNRRPEAFVEGPTLVMVVEDSLLEEALQYARLRLLSGEVPAIYTLEWVDQHLFGGDRFYRIRLLLQQLWQRFGRYHVLLVGGPDAIPLGWSRVPGVFPSDPFYETFPTEFGYMFLDGLWDRNGDGLGGELADSVDLQPDVIVGRLPLSTRQEFMNYVEKVRTWLTHPQLTPTLLVLASKLSPYLSGALYAHYALGVIYPRMAPAWMLESEEHTNTREELSAYLQTGIRGLVTVQHGFESKVAINYAPWIEWSGYTGPDVDHAPPFWMVPVTCDAAAVDLEGFYAGMLRRPGGPVVLFGAQRLNFPDISKFAVRWMMQRALSDSTLRFGDLAMAGLEPLLPYSQYNSVVRYQYLSYSILGDPTLPLWVDTLRPLDMEVQVDPGDPIQVHIALSDPPKDVYRVVLWRPATGELIRMRTYQTSLTFRFNPGLSGGDTLWVSVWDRGHPVQMKHVVLDEIKPLRLMDYAFTRVDTSVELAVRIRVHPLFGPDSIHGKISGSGPWRPETIRRDVIPGDTVVLHFRAAGWNPDTTEQIQLVLNGQMARLILRPAVLDPDIRLLFAGMQGDTGYLHLDVQGGDTALKVEVVPADSIWTRWIQPGLLRIQWLSPDFALEQQASQPRKVTVRVTGGDLFWERVLYLPTRHGPLATPDVVSIPGGVRFYLPYSQDTVRGVIVHARHNGQWTLLTPYPIEGSRWFDLPLTHPDTLRFHALDSSHVVVAYSEPVAVTPGPPIQKKISLPNAPIMAPVPLPTSPVGEPAILVVDRDAILTAWTLEGVPIRGHLDLGTEPLGPPVVVRGSDPGVIWMYWRLPRQVIRVRWDIKGMVRYETPLPGNTRLMAADLDGNGWAELYAWTPDGWLLRDTYGQLDTLGSAGVVQGAPVLVNTEQSPMLVWSTQNGLRGYHPSTGVFPFRSEDSLELNLWFAGPFDPLHPGEDALVGVTDSSLVLVVMEGDRAQVIREIPLPGQILTRPFVWIPEGPISHPGLLLATRDTLLELDPVLGTIRGVGAGSAFLRVRWNGVGFEHGAWLPVRDRRLMGVHLPAFPLLMDQPPLVEPVAMPLPDGKSMLMVVQGREITVLALPESAIWSMRRHDLFRTGNLGTPFWPGQRGIQAVAGLRRDTRLQFPTVVRGNLRLLNPGSARVTLEIYDRSGRRIRQVALAPMRTVTLRLPRTGLFLVRWREGTRTVTRKVVVLP